MRGCIVRCSPKNHRLALSRQAVISSTVRDDGSDEHGDLVLEGAVARTAGTPRHCAAKPYTTGDLSSLQAMLSSYRLRPGTGLGFGRCSVGRFSIYGGYGIGLSWGTASSLGFTRRGGTRHPLWPGRGREMWTACPLSSTGLVTVGWSRSRHWCVAVCHGRYR